MSARSTQKQLADIGAKAIEFVHTRAARMAARRERNQLASEFSEERGGDARYSEESDHRLGYSPEFLAFTNEAQQRYQLAVTSEKSARGRLYAAVRKHARGGAA